MLPSCRCIILTVAITSSIAIFSPQCGAAPIPQTHQNLDPEMEALFDDMLALCLEFAKNPQMQQIFARLSSTSDLNATMVVPLDKVIEMVRDLAKNPDMPQMMARMSAVSEKTFELSDVNKDNHVDLAEHKEFYHKLFPYMGNKLLALVPADKRAEAEKMLPKFLAKVYPMLERLFHTLDADGDGRLTKAEDMIHLELEVEDL